MPDTSRSVEDAFFSAGGELLVKPKVRYNWKRKPSSFFQYFALTKLAQMAYSQKHQNFLTTFLLLVSQKPAPAFVYPYSALVLIR